MISRFEGTRTKENLKLIFPEYWQLSYHVLFTALPIITYLYYSITSVQWSSEFYFTKLSYFFCPIIYLWNFHSLAPLCAQHFVESFSMDNNNWRLKCTNHSTVKKKKVKKRKLSGICICKGNMSSKIWKTLSLKRSCLTHKRRRSHVDAYLHLCTKYRNKKKYYEITNYNDTRSRRGPISIANQQPTVDATADRAHFSSCYDSVCPAGHHLCGQLGTCGNRWQWIDLNL